MKTNTFNNFVFFKNALHEHNIRSIVAKNINEIRPETKEDSSVIVGHVYKGTFIAYKDGLILKYNTHNQEEMVGFCNLLTKEGIEIKHSSDNIG